MMPRWLRRLWPVRPRFQWYVCRGCGSEFYSATLRASEDCQFCGESKTVVVR